jgi:hypothetical protein
VSRFSVVYIRTSLQTIDHLHNVVRDRPFNLQGGRLWFFVSIRIFFPDNTRVRILIFFQNSTLGYMTKTLNQIIFFFLHQNQNIFLENKHNPPSPLQFNGRSLKRWFWDGHMYRCFDFHMEMGEMMNYSFRKFVLVMATCDHSISYCSLGAANELSFYMLLLGMYQHLNMKLIPQTQRIHLWGVVPCSADTGSISVPQDFLGSFLKVSNQ